MPFHFPLRAVPARRRGTAVFPGPRLSVRFSAKLSAIGGKTFAGSVQGGLGKVHPTLAELGLMG